MRVEEDLEKYISMPEIGDFYHNNNWKIESAELRGEELGEKRKSIRTAKMMLARNYSIDEVSLITELPISEIEKLQN